MNENTLSDQNFGIRLEVCSGSQIDLYRKVLNEIDDLAYSAESLAICQTII